MKGSCCGAGWKLDDDELATGLWNVHIETGVPKHRKSDGKRPNKAVNMEIVELDTTMSVKLARAPRGVCVLEPTFAAVWKSLELQVPDVSAVGAGSWSRSFCAYSSGCSEDRR